MEDDVATLGVGFAIDFYDSFGQLKSLDDLLGTTQANAVREFQRIQAAAKGSVDMAGPKAELAEFGTVMTRTAAQTEKSAEAMVRQINRQIEVFGKSAAEVRNLRAETKALAAEQNNMPELATRLRAAAAEMQRLEVAAGGAAVASGKNAFALKQVALQTPDIVGGLLTGQKPFQVLIQQGSQIVQVAQMAEGGMKGFATQLMASLLPFAPLIAALAAGAAGFALFGRAVSQDVDTKAMVDGLGLTRAEIKRLKDTTVSSGDVIKATFQVMAERVGLHLGNMGKWFSDVLDTMTTYGRLALAGLYSRFVGTFRAIGAIVRGVLDGKGISEILGDVGNAYGDAFKEADGAMKRFGADVTKQIASNKLADLKKQAAEIKLDRTPKTDRHAQQLAREAEAIEAQIRNLNALADAYGVSGAAALIAEARVKAESQAIKQRGDIEAAVARQIRLSIAQRTTDAAKGTALMREQADIQQRVNEQVAAGIVPASQAAELVRNQIADLPLLAALQAAQQQGLADDAAKATAALAAQREERDRLAQLDRQRQFLEAQTTADDRLAQLREELRLVGATEDVRIRALATLKATQEAQRLNPEDRGSFIAKQVSVAVLTEDVARAVRNLNIELSFTADRWDLIARNVQNAASGMADAFGEAGRALGDLAAIYANFQANRARLDLQHKKEIDAAGTDEARVARENAKYALATATSQIGLYGDMASAAQGFFDKGSKGYSALGDAIKVFRAIEFALSVRAMAQDAAATAASVANSILRTGRHAVEAVVKAISSLPFPLNLAAGAATAGAIAALGVSIVSSFGGGGKLAQSNTGTGTVLGNSDAKSESIKNAIDQLKEVDTSTLSYSRQMAASLRAIESQMGNFASVLVRNADSINATGNTALGFKPNLIGQVLGSIPLVGGLLSGLFGSRTDVTGSGLYGGPQSLGSVLGGGFNAQYYSDIQKTSKFFGIVTGRSNSTQYSSADPALANQFTLILRQFNDAIVAAAGPLGVATDDIQNRLNGFVVNIGKIDLKGLTGEEIQEKLNAVFGQAADNMATAAFPLIQQFQKVGEGAFETLVRVASTLEAVSGSLDLLGNSAQGMSIATKLALVDQFDSLSALTSAADAYFSDFYTKEEQAAARTAQLGKVFSSLGLTMPDTIAGFRQLVEAQNLNTAAGQAAYATLLQMAPAFAELKNSIEGVKSAADIADERMDLQRQLLELRGDTAALRALDLAKLDASNRALQQQVWAVEAANELRDAWKSVGDTIMDEVRRIRGLSDATGDGSFASLQGQFNALTLSARNGDVEAGNSLPGLSQALLAAAANAATSRQELDRIRAQTAASLEKTSGLISALTNGSAASESVMLSRAATVASVSAPASQSSTSADSGVSELRGLRQDVATLRLALEGIKLDTGKTARVLDRADRGGALAVVTDSDAPLEVHAA